ncbi:MAG TPA: LysR family transcriptional regulator, partial [Acetobacteraceae bacterium]|nr:LysR family transcriptional regulator [Acetobacteraceae bacterium]
MNWNTFDLNLLVVFDAVMQDRNLTRAGQRLGLSQSAISHALARLRHMLDDELFVRSSDGMLPTPRAERICGPIHDSLQAMRVALESDEFDAAQTARTFTIAANNYAALAVVPILVHRMAKLAPAAGLEVRPIGMTPALDQLDRGTVDLALGTLVEGGERFKCAGLLVDEFVALLSNDLPIAGEPALSVEQFAQVPQIAVTSSGDNTGFIDEALAGYGLSRHIATKVPLHSLWPVLIGSGALAVVPRRVAADAVAFRPLTMRPLPFPSPQVSLSMIWHRRLDHDPAHRWLRATLRA